MLRCFATDYFICWLDIFLVSDGFYSVIWLDFNLSTILTPWFFFSRTFVLLFFFLFMRFGECIYGWGTDYETLFLSAISFFFPYHILDIWILLLLWIACARHATTDWVVFWDYGRSFGRRVVRNGKARGGTRNRTFWWLRNVLSGV